MQACSVSTAYLLSCSQLWNVVGKLGVITTDVVLATYERIRNEQPRAMAKVVMSSLGEQRCLPVLLPVRVLCVCAASPPAALRAIPICMAESVTNLLTKAVHPRIYALLQSIHEQGGPTPLECRSGAVSRCGVSSSLPTLCSRSLPFSSAGEAALSETLSALHAHCCAPRLP